MESFNDFFQRALNEVKTGNHKTFRLVVLSGSFPIPEAEWPDGMDSFVWIASPHGRLHYTAETPHWGEHYTLVLTADGGEHLGRMSPDERTEDVSAWIE